jgi:hypothetical protein
MQTVRSHAPPQAPACGKITIYWVSIALFFKFHDWMHVKFVSADYRDMSAPKDPVTSATPRPIAFDIALFRSCYCRVGEYCRRNLIGPDSNISATRHFHHFGALGSATKQEGKRDELEKIVPTAFERS